MARFSAEFIGPFDQAAGPPRVLAAGRLDNPDELAKVLALDPADLSVEQVLVVGIDQLGKGLVAKLRGPFCFAVRTVRGPVLLARDPLGTIPLYYRWSDKGVLSVSTELTDLLQDRPNLRLDPQQVARFFALENPTVGRTFFHGIYEVPPGSILEVDSEKAKGEVFWSADTIKRRRLADLDYTRRYRRLLEQSTRRCTDSALGAGVMLSGGLDSSSLAMTLAGLEQRRGPTKVFSWVFDELDSCDERGWIEQVTKAGQFESFRISGDDCWPLCDLADFCTLLGTPEENPYRALKNKLFRRAGEEGVDLLLNGGPADILHREGKFFLRDLIRDGFWLTAVAEFWKESRQRSLRSALSAVAQVTRGKSRRGGSRRHWPWLTENAATAVRESLSEGRIGTTPELGRREIAGYLRSEGRGIGLERDYTRPYGVTVESPYWDRDVVEFFLSLPADQLYRPGQTKYVSRYAMAGKVPETIRLRQAPTHLDPLFDRGLFERESSVVHDLLSARDASWPRFVESEFLESLGPNSTPAEKVLLWRCVSFELWRQKHDWLLS